MGFYEYLEKSIKGEFEYNTAQAKFNEYIYSKEKEILTILTYIRKQVDVKHRKLKRKYTSEIGNIGNGLIGVTYADYPVGFCGIITDDVFDVFKETHIFSDLIQRGIIIKNLPA